MKKLTDLASDVRNILVWDWDPVGIQGILEASDEYDMYMPHICKMILENKSTGEVFRYLCWIEVDRMGLEAGGAITLRTAEKLARLRTDLPKKSEGQFPDF